MAARSTVKDKVKTKKVVKKKTLSKKEREAKALRAFEDICHDIIYEIEDVCEQDKNVATVLVGSTFALLTKKCSVTIKKVINPDSMQPRELEIEKTFFHLFVLWWGMDGELDVVYPSYFSSLGTELEKMISMGIPRYELQNIDGIRGIIKDA